MDPAPGHENEAKLIFDSGGHYDLINGEIVWRHLDNITSIIRALPADYYPEGR